MKKIIYFVGPYGSGKTTAVQEYGKILKSVQILEDETMLELLKQIRVKNMPIIESFVLMSYYYRLIKAIKEGAETILVDGHPLLMLIYMRANFELENGMDVNIRDLMDFGRTRYQMWDLTKDLFSDYEQIIVYINLPENVHYCLVEDRYDDREEDFPFELDYDWFLAVRRILNSEIRHVGKEMYSCKIVEVNSLGELMDLDFLD